jgi:hypothetical protein
MRVLFAAPYRDGTGYGQAAIDYILALDAAGVDVVPGLVTYNRRNVPVPERIEELEAKSIRDCDVVIQNTIPGSFDYNGHFDKNIGLFFTETSNFRSQSEWVRQCNTMDELWVGSKDSIHHVDASDVTTPVINVPVPCDPGKYAKRYDPFTIQEAQDKFAFYFIAEYSRRKNLTALLKAFHLEFHKREDVCLVIKSNIPGKSKADSVRRIVEHCTDIKKQLGLYDRISDYHEEHIIADYLDEEQMMSLHQTCDCFVMPSFAEGWCLPAFDAMAMGNTPICSDIGGIRDFMDNRHGTLIPVQPQPVFGMKEWEQVPNLYTGSQQWWECDIYEMRHAMREMFEQEEARKEMSIAGIDRAYDFTHQIVGQTMKETLDGQRKASVFNRTATKRKKHSRESVA